MDWWGRLAPAQTQRIPREPSTGTYRVVRGGSWREDAGYCSSAFRFGINPSDGFLPLGFRVVRRP